MGALKKGIRSDVRRAARMVIAQYYLKEHKRPLPKRRLNALVKRVGLEAVPGIMEDLRSQDDPRATVHGSKK